MCLANDIQQRSFKPEARSYGAALHGWLQYPEADLLTIYLLADLIVLLCEAYETAN